MNIKAKFQEKQNKEPFPFEKKKKKKNSSNVRECLNNGLKGLPAPGGLKWQNKTYQFITKGESDKRRILTNTETGMTMPLQATFPHSCTPSPCLSHLLSLHHRWLLVGVREGMAAPQ